MPHVSKIKLRPKDRRNIENLFVRLVLEFKNEGDLESFFESFLSDTERLMLAKRFMAIYLLENKGSIRKISQTLNLSPATVIKLDLKRQLNHKSFLMAFKKLDSALLRDTLKAMIKSLGKKFVLQIIRGGRIKLPQG